MFDKGESRCVSLGINENELVDCSGLSDHLAASHFNPDSKDDKFRDSFGGGLNTEDNVSDNKGIKLSWHCIKKTVLVNESNSGLLRSSIALPSIESLEEFKKVGPTPKIILNGVSAFAEPGEVLALMGPSGSGKTSLLDTISGRSSFDSGVLMINGKEANASAIKQAKRNLGYVTQEDILFDHLTVREQFTYTALLRLPSVWSRDRKFKEVGNLISLLKLEKCANTLVRLASGGEKKRVSIGIELLANPSIMILDEPTNGLDSSSAKSLMKMLKDLAKKHNKTIITSIHQPNSAVFQSFDMLLMLADGCVVYHGTPIGSFQYLKEQGCDCPPGYNVADHWIELLTTVSSTKGEKSSQVKVGMQTKMSLIAAWEKECLEEGIKWRVDNIETTLDNLKVAKTISNKCSTTWYTQFSILSHRSFRKSRTALINPAKLIRAIFLSIFGGTLWLRTKYTEENILDISGFLFFNILFQGNWAIWTALDDFPSEREIITKERESGTYCLSAYLMAKTISSVPIRLFHSLLCVTITYWISMINPRVGVFLGYNLFIMSAVIVCDSFGFLCGVSISCIQKRNAVLTGAHTVMILTSGFLFESYPPFLEWVKYLSPYKYAFDASRKLMFGNNLPCDGSGALPKLCGKDAVGFASADEVVEFNNFEGSFLFNFGVLLVMFAVLRYATYLCLWMRTP